MITTAVQQATQMVEIQGAPAPAQASGDAFRATFAASVGDPAAGKTGQNSAQMGVDKAAGSAAASSGLASSKHVLVAGLVAGNSSAAKSNALQNLLQGKKGTQDEGELETAPDTASASDIKAASGLALAASSASAAAAGAASAATLARPTASTQTAEEAALTQAGPGAAKLPAPAAVNGAALSDEISKSSESAASTGVVTVRVRKDEASADKSAVSVTAAAVPSGPSVAAGGIRPEAVPVVPVLESVTAGPADAVSTVQGRTKSVPLATAQAGDSAKPPAGGPAGSIYSASGSASTAVWGELAPLGQDALANAVAPATSNTQRTSGEVESLRAGQVDASGAKSERIGVVALSDAGDASLTLKSAAEPGTNASAALAASVAASAKASTAGEPTKTSSSVNGIGVKTGTASVPAEIAAPPQVKTAAQAHAGSLSQATSATQAAVSKAVGSTQGTAPALQGKDADAGASAAAPVEPVASVPVVPAHGEVKLPQTVDAATAVAAAPQAVSRSVLPPAKDEKSKSSVSVIEDTDSARSTSSLGDLSNLVSAPLTTQVAAAASVAGRVIAGTEAAVPVVQATSHGAGSVSPVGAAATGTATSARALGAVSALSLPESVSAASPAGETHRTLLATPTSLEVGVQSGTQGWLRIRADIAGPGEVNASLSAASSGGRDLLHSQLPALNAFLHSEQISATTTVTDRGVFGAGGGQAGTALGSGGLGSDASGGSNASLLQGGGAQSGGTQHESTRQPSLTGVSEMVRSYDARSGVSDAGHLSAGTAASEESGRWLNVRV